MLTIHVPYQHGLDDLIVNWKPMSTPGSSLVFQSFYSCMAFLITTTLRMKWRLLCAMSTGASQGECWYRPYLNCAFGMSLAQEPINLARYWSLSDGTFDMQPAHMPASQRPLSIATVLALFIYVWSIDLIILTDQNQIFRSFIFKIEIEIRLVSVGGMYI